MPKSCMRESLIEEGRKISQKKVFCIAASARQWATAVRHVMPFPSNDLTETRTTFLIHRIPLRSSMSGNRILLYLGVCPIKGLCLLSLGSIHVYSNLVYLD